ncbi:hypothetical protein PR202_gb13077 [Eleusine coracana subsp. coracana]|uniref:Uncharacterized protein n=1 Tax=Eleusine coracana subsp. coracana TaxID=191504 RepID=A0AAV5EPC0_ELECO|nr:hypothetical protein PR202_gb13077 [Eleusine coracana subsp. coracana]
MGPQRSNDRSSASLTAMWDHSGTHKSVGRARLYNGEPFPFLPLHPPGAATDHHHSALSRASPPTPPKTPPASAQTLAPRPPDCNVEAPDRRPRGRPRAADAAAKAAEKAKALAADGTTAPAAAAAAKKKMVAEEEDPRLRWAFVRKVYCILALQVAATAGIATAACYVRPVPRFFEHGRPAAVWSVFIAILVAPILVMIPMLRFRERHPVNLVLLGIFTLCCSLSIAVSASTTVGVAVLQAAILTATAVIGLTLFTFWAIERGYDFDFMFPFLFTSLLTLLVYITIQIFIPLGRVGTTIYGLLATLVFSGYIVFDTHMLLKRHTYNEYIVAAIALYLDVINLFMSQIMLTIQ